MVRISYVFRVMIASPGDLSSHRDAVEQAIHEWNTEHSERAQVVLVPWRWETSAIPEMGDHPQSILNRQGVDSSDIVIALFGSRLGTPTSDAISGTVEEIDRSIASAKPVHLYFCTAPVSYDVDLVQLGALREFKKQTQARGLYFEYKEGSELKDRVKSALSRDIAASYLGKLPARPRREPARFTAYTVWGPGMRPDERVYVKNEGGHYAQNVRINEASGRFTPQANRKQVDIGVGSSECFLIERTGDAHDIGVYSLLIEWYDDWTQEDMQQQLRVKYASVRTPTPYPNYNLADDEM